MTNYHVSVDHTDTLGGQPSFTEITVNAESEEKALEHAKTNDQWPDERFYDEDEDVEVREL